MTTATSIRLLDYTPWAFDLPEIVLDVNIQSDHVVVKSRLSLEPRRSGEPLVLCGRRSGH
jgi:aminopeptidase N